MFVFDFFDCFAVCLKYRWNVHFTIYWANKLFVSKWYVLHKNQWLFVELLHWRFRLAPVRTRPRLHISLKGIIHQDVGWRLWLFQLFGPGRCQTLCSNNNIRMKNKFSCFKSYFDHTHNFFKTQLKLLTVLVTSFSFFLLVRVIVTQFTRNCN